MNFKTIRTIIAILSFDILVLSSPFNNINSTNAIDNSLNSVEDSQNISKDTYLIDEAEVIDINDEKETNDIEDYDEVCNTKECIDVSNRILNSIDSSVDPCEDFYQFTCGNWMKNNIADKNTDIINNFSILNENTTNSILKILEGTYKPNNNLSVEDQAYDEQLFNKLKNFYHSCMDIDTINEEGGKPMIRLIDQLKINDIKNKSINNNELSIILAKIHERKVFYNPLFSIEFFLDDDMKIYIGFTEAMSLIYNKQKPVSEIEEEIKSTLSRIYKDSKDRDLDRMAELILEFDNKLFEENNEYNDNNNDENVNEDTNEGQDTPFEPILKSLNSKFSGIKWRLNVKRSNLSNSDDGENYVYDENEYINSIKPISLKSLNEKFPNINWKLYLEERFNVIDMKEYITDDTEVILSNETYIETLNRVLGEVESEALSYYLEWYLINNYLPYISNEENLNDKIQRTDECYGNINNIMDSIIARFYILNHFSPDKKQYAEKVIEYIKQSMINRIPEMEWLDDETIEYAYKKVAAMTEMVGYQDYLMDPKYLYEKYEKMEIGNDYFNNIVSYILYKNNEDMKNFNSTINEIILPDITPYTINAQYLLFKNSMEIPAGILQPPFFSSGIPDYLNYGGLGSLIGHELTHAFDNNGKDFDMDGNINNWWTENDLEEYEELTKCFIDQYDQFYLVDNKGEKHYNDGSLTLNENLADSGGLARAYESWKLSLKEDPETVKKENPPLPGLTQYTQDQLFFISYGYHWCESINTDPEYVNMYLMDEHAPGIARVNGVVSNSKQFAKAFNCPLKSKMNPEKKCAIW